MLGLCLALFALVAAGFLWTRDRPVAIATEAPALLAASDPADADTPEPETGLVAPRSNVTPAQKEARRFGRYDKDSDDRITRGEYLASRQKAFARLDRDGDGKLAFDEYSAATLKKFGKADRNADGVLVAKEFAATARKQRERSGPPCVPESG